MKSDSIETLLGSHAASVLTQPLLREGGEDDDGLKGEGRISSRDFVTPRREIKAGDFVELRRHNTAVGIVLPVPDDVLKQEAEAEGVLATATAQRNKTSMKDLYVLVTSGQIVLYKENDVMIQYPRCH